MPTGHLAAAHLRIARPTDDLAPVIRFYCDGLGFTHLAAFVDHEGFDGIMVGASGADYHFEFTHCRAHPVRPQPTAEDLVVLYLPDRAVWEAACARMLDAGFREVEPFNPYWQRFGRTFEDPDGYRTVLQNAGWMA